MQMRVMDTVCVFIGASPRHVPVQTLFKLYQRHPDLLLLRHLLNLSIRLPEAILALANLSLGPERYRNALYLGVFPTHDKKELFWYLDHRAVRCPDSAA